MPDPHYKDLILPLNSTTSLTHLLTTLKRQNLTIHNRLTSIQADASFVLSVGKAYQRPLVANERCGSWYVLPEEKKGSAYFKSTDGHERAWKFSTRRLNLHIVDMVERNDGVIIVDSTRRGKRMPDALSTTIPIWCTVLNQLLLADNPLSSSLHLPPSHSASTHAQITALLPDFLSSLRSLNLSTLPTLTKPLRPFWVTQDSILPDESGEIFEEYRPVICCTASRRVVGGSEMDEGGYIQGAGDDTENWAFELTPDVFWENVEELLRCAEAELPELISSLVERRKGEIGEGDGAKKQLTSQISVCPLPLSIDGETTSQILITAESTTKETWAKSPRRLEVGLGKNSKTASRNLRLALVEICDFASKYMHSQEGKGQIMVACESGKDLSVGTALALHCYLFDDEDRFRLADENTSFTKTMVKVRLGRIMTVMPEANPSRATLQAVNSFLMDWRN